MIALLAPFVYFLRAPAGMTDEKNDRKKASVRLENLPYGELVAGSQRRKKRTEIALRWIPAWRFQTNGMDNQRRPCGAPRFPTLTDLPNSGTFRAGIFRPATQPAHFLTHLSPTPAREVSV